MKHFKPILIVVLFCLSQPIFAQKMKVSGKVINASNGYAIESVAVVVKSTGTGTVTNVSGIYSVNADPNDVLEFSIVGFSSQSIQINGRWEINVQLQPSLTELNQVVLVGSRGAGRIKTETAVPVDIVNVKQASLPTSRMDLSSILNYAAPSFNYNKQSGSDGADHIDLATLRGLGPDQTLVLINGKRRHQTAFVSVFGTRGRGNSGTDISAIPIASIDRVEILRDGASAQYGSDAIAGVINIILKKDVGVLSVNAGYSGYYDKKYNTYFKKSLGQYEYSGPVDGQAFNINANYGAALDDRGGFFNMSLVLNTSGKTFRQVLDTNILNEGGLPLNPYRRANGDGSLTSIGTLINMEVPIYNSNATFYAFGGYTSKSSDAFAFSRNFSARPERFPNKENGNPFKLEYIIKTTPDGERYYNPRIQTVIGDGSMAAGIKGSCSNKWNWDFSNSIGINTFHFYGHNTFNASLGALQTHFDDGGFRFLQNTTNASMSKNFKSIGAGLNLAFGAELRLENYKLIAGEKASYKNYNPSKASGAQGFPGYQPNDEVQQGRSNLAGYVDVEFDVTKKFLVGAAIRLENYSDFGFTSNYKVDSRLKVTNNFNLRGSFSTGFRAPSLQQINFSSTFTTVQGASIAEVKIAPNNSPITKSAGISELTQEKSLNGSFGFSWKPVREFSISIDGYWVNVKDRVVLSGQFDASDNTLDPAFTSTLKRLKVAYAQFFANAVNTTNKGVDIVLEYNKRFSNNSFKVLLAGNLQKMSIDKINVPAKLNDTESHRQTFLSDRERLFILASEPPAKVALNLEYGINKFSIGTRFTYFGKVELNGYGEDGLGINPQVPTDNDASVYVADKYVYNGKVVSDLYFTFKASKKVSIFLGADNLFNVHPDLAFAPGAKYWAYNNEPAGPFDAVQMGGNGTRFFTRIALDIK